MVAPGSFIQFPSTQTSSKTPQHDAATTVFCPLGDATPVPNCCQKKQKAKLHTETILGVGLSHKILMKFVTFGRPVVKGWNLQGLQIQKY